MHPRQYDEYLVSLDQIRTGDQQRLIKRPGQLKQKEIQAGKAVLQEMLVD